MLIREAPEGLSNTKLVTCQKIIKKLSGESWTIKTRPCEIYNILGTHDIFKEFAYSNQALCKQLRPHFLSKDKKRLSQEELESRLDSLQEKKRISYKGPKNNNLLEY